MDQNSSQSSSQNHSQAVDALLNDILGGSSSGNSASADPASSSVSSASSTRPMMSIEPEAPDHNEVKVVEEVLRDAVVGGSDDVAPPPPTPRKYDFSDAESGVPVRPKPLAMHGEQTPEVKPASDMPMTPPPVVETKPIAPVTPMAPVAPMNAQPTVSNEAGDKFAVAQAPKSNVSKTSIIAAVAVIAVVLGGVGAGIALSGQEQDVRNQAYVAPTQEKLVGGAPAVNPSQIVIEMTPYTTFVSLQARYQSAVSKQFAGQDGVSGNVYSANGENGHQVIFAEISGLSPKTSTAVPTAWVVYPDGTHYAFSSIELDPEQGNKGYASYENLSDNPIVGFVVSYENPNNASDVGLAIEPVDKVVDVRF